jgi:hypothetical protein
MRLTGILSSSTRISLPIRFFLWLMSKVEKSNFVKLENHRYDGNFSLYLYSFLHYNQLDLNVSSRNPLDNHHNPAISIKDVVDRLEPTSSPNPLLPASLIIHQIIVPPISPAPRWIPSSIEVPPPMEGVVLGEKQQGNLQMERLAPHWTAGRGW